MQVFQPGDTIFFLHFHLIAILTTVSDKEYSLYFYGSMLGRRCFEMYGEKQWFKKIHNMFLPDEMFCFNRCLITKTTFSLRENNICSRIYTQTPDAMV